MRYLIFVVLLSLGCPAFAQATNSNSLDLTGLSDAAIAELRVKAAEAQRDQAEGTIEILDDLTVEDVERWGAMGNVISTTITDTASGVGMAVDDFMNTDTGTLIAFAVIWHFAGDNITEFAEDFISAVFGIFVIFPIVIYMHRRYVYIQRTSGYEYVQVKGLFGSEKFVKRPIWKETLTKGEQGEINTSQVVTLVLVCIIIVFFMPW